MKIRCVGIDDHQTSLELLESYVSKLDYLEWAGGFTDPLKAINEMDGLEPQLIFLDMQMPGISGLEFLKTKKPTQPVIIVSDYKDFAFDSYAISNEHNIVILDYLSKIILLPRFIQACEKARLYLSKNSETTDTILYAKTIQNNMEQIDLSQVQYVEADGQEMRFYTNDKTRPICSIRITMVKLEERLHQQRFLRVHRGYLVNPRFVSKYSLPDIVIMANSKEISIGRTYQTAIKEYFQARKLG